MRLFASPDEVTMFKHSKSVAILRCLLVVGAARVGAAEAESLRCGTRLVNERELAVQVREKCGDPVSEELIGYTVRPAPSGFRGEREYKVEQWVYGPDKGYYHVLVFEAGRLRSIDHVRQ